MGGPRGEDADRRPHREAIEIYYHDTELMLKFVLESGSGHVIDLTPRRVNPQA